MASGDEFLYFGTAKEYGSLSGSSGAPLCFDCITDEGNWPPPAGLKVIVVIPCGCMAGAYEMRFCQTSDAGGACYWEFKSIPFPNVVWYVKVQFGRVAPVFPSTEYTYCCNVWTYLIWQPDGLPDGFMSAPPCSMGGEALVGIGSSCVYSNCSASPGPCGHCQSLVGCEVPIFTAYSAGPTEIPGCTEPQCCDKVTVYIQ